MEHDGYKYVNNGGRRNGITYYKCIRAQTHFCRGSIKKFENGTIEMVKQHEGHEREVDNVFLVNTFRRILKHRAATENILLKNIYDEEARRHMAAAGVYPWSSAESIMRLARRQSLPILPQNLSGLATEFENGHLNRFSCCEVILFRRCVRDIDNKTHVVLACTQLITSVLEQNVTELHVDGTFKVVPRNMGYQLLTFHCIIQNHSIPIIYILMECKTRNAYNCVLGFIKTNLLPTFLPETIITDYKTALRDELHSHFPGSRTVGCWFHHNQAVWKKMKTMGYLNLINTNGHALKTLQLLLTLPLLPSHKMDMGFTLVTAFARHHGVHMENFFQYYQRYWLRTVGPNIVSVHGLPRRTNNNVESFHNVLKLKFNVQHPNLWIFLGHLTNLNCNYHIVVQQLNNGLRPTRNLRIKFIANSRRIKSATDQLDIGLISVWQFLQRCSYASSSYELRQRNWASRNNGDNEDIDNGVNEMDRNLEEEAEIEAVLNNEDAPIPIPQNDEPAMSNVCMVCLVVTANDSAAKYVVIPCGHAWVCGMCVVQLELSNSACPLCRTANISFQRIYLR